MKLTALILSLPTENAIARQRAWRALKASGAAVLRDGVYLMPARDDCRATLNTLAAQVNEAGGTAHVLCVEADEDAKFAALFDRSEDYAALLAEVDQARDTLTADTVRHALKHARKLRKSFAAVVEIDFFLLVHYLDVGGVQPPEAAGIESVLAGMRENITRDDLLLDAASAVFDGLLANFRKGEEL